MDDKKFKCSGGCWKASITFPLCGLNLSLTLKNIVWNLEELKPWPLCYRESYHVIGIYKLSIFSWGKKRWRKHYFSTFSKTQTLKYCIELSTQTLHLISSWSTFGSGYSLRPSGLWYYKLCKPGFGDILTFFSADPLKLRLDGDCWWRDIFCTVLSDVTPYGSLQIMSSCWMYLMWTLVKM